MEHRFNFFRVCILYCFFSTEYVMGVYVHSSGFLFANNLIAYAMKSNGLLLQIIKNNVFDSWNVYCCQI